MAAGDFKVAQFGVESVEADTDDFKVAQFGVETVEADSGAAQIAQFGIEILVVDESDGSGSEEPPEEEECECCVATQLNVLNNALTKIGISTEVLSLSENTKEARLGSRLYLPTLKETLRLHPWAFATKYAPASDTPGDPMELVLGTEADPITNNDWLYAYRYPSDCLFARRLVPAGTGRKYNGDPIPFRVGRTTDFGADDDYLLVFTNEPDAELEYTCLVECREDFPDALFENAVEWGLAAKLAPALAQDDKVTKGAWLMYMQACGVAEVVTEREQQQEKDGDAPWISGR